MVTRDGPAHGLCWAGSGRKAILMALEVVLEKEWLRMSFMVPEATPGERVSWAVYSEAE